MDDIAMNQYYGIYYNSVSTLFEGEQGIGK